MNCSQRLLSFKYTLLGRRFVTLCFQVLKSWHPSVSIDHGSLHTGVLSPECRPGQSRQEGQLFPRSRPPLPTTPVFSKGTAKTNTAWHRWRRSREGLSNLHCTCLHSNVRLHVPTCVIGKHVYQHGLEVHNWYVTLEDCSDGLRL